MRRSIFAPRTCSMLLDQVLVLTGDERESVAGLRDAAGPADAVRVSIRRVRDIIVDDMGYAQHIDTAGCDIGCHENLVRAVAEAVECFLALVLREVPLERGSFVPCLLQLLPDALGPVLGAREDQDGFRIGLFQEFHEKCGLQVLLDRIESMGHGTRGR